MEEKYERDLNLIFFLFLFFSFFFFFLMEQESDIRFLFYESTALRLFLRNGKTINNQNKATIRAEVRRVFSVIFLSSPQQ